MNKYLVRNFKWRENHGKVPAKVYRLDNFMGQCGIHGKNFINSRAPKLAKKISVLSYVLSGGPLIFF